MKIGPILAREIQNERMVANRSHGDRIFGGIYSWLEDSKHGVLETFGFFFAIFLVVVLVGVEQLVH